MIENFLQDHPNLDLLSFDPLSCECCQLSFGVVVSSQKVFFICPKCQEEIVKRRPEMKCDCCERRGCGGCALCYGEEVDHQVMSCKYRRPSPFWFVDIFFQTNTWKINYIEEYRKHKIYPNCTFHLKNQDPYQIFDLNSY